jgi:hypothetical protein
MTQRRAALFIDFDNFFGGLLGSDPTAAMALAERPSVWIHRLAAASGGEGADSSRRWLVLRCYMNPSGSVAHPLNPGQRLYFSTFRPFFTQAGVEVVDCPSLTRGAKNGADIRIVIDVMTALQHHAHYDEFVLASSDADFTPLLQVLRAQDRRTCIIATGATAVAYEALADQYLDEQDLFDLMAPAPAEEPVPGSGDGVPAPGGCFSPGAAPIAGPSEDPGAWHEFCAVVRSDYESSEGPVSLSRLAGRIHADMGEVVTRTRWFGSGSFRRAVELVDLPEVEFSNLHFWHRTRHRAPEPAPAAPPAPVRPPLPAAVTRFCDVAKMPRLCRAQWTIVFRVLAEYARRGEFTLSEASRWSRDRAGELGVQVSRQAMLYAIRGARNGGADLCAAPPPDASAVGRAVLASVLEQAVLAGFHPSAAERQELAAWLGAGAPAPVPAD